VKDAPATADGTAGPAGACPLSAGQVTWLGLGVNGVLATVKIVAGWMLHSQALTADGLHAASDLGTDVATLWSLGVSTRPPDAGHPYGHRRIGTLIAFAIALLLGAAGGWVFWQALLTLGGQSPREAVRPLAVAFSAASIPFKEALYRMSMCIGRRTGDLTVQANAWHHRTDALASLAATAGLVGVALGGQAWMFLDSAAALVLAAFLVAVSVGLIVRAVGDLTDRAPRQATQAAIVRAVAATGGVRGFHACRARLVGGRVAVDVHVQVDGQLTVDQGHEIARAVKQSVLSADDDVMEVMVHIEPAEADRLQGSS